MELLPGGDEILVEVSLSSVLELLLWPTIT